MQGTNISKKAVGSFIVITKEKEKRLVVVSQNNVPYYTKDKTYIGKYFNLDHVDGPEVFETKKTNIFRLFDGTELIKRGNMQQI